MPSVLCSLVLLSTLLASPVQAQAYTLLGFDDLPSAETPIPSGYGGFEWDNFASYSTCVDTPEHDFCAGMLSFPNVAINGGGNPAALRSVGGIPFYFLVGSFGSVSDYDVQLKIEGFLGGSLVDDLTFDIAYNSINTWSTPWIVDELRFTPTMIDPDAPTGTAARFAFDEFYFANVVPEPASMVLLLAGLAGLAVVQHRRARAMANF